MIDLEVNVKELSQSKREQISEDDNEVRASWQIEKCWILIELQENNLGSIPVMKEGTREIDNVDEREYYEGRGESNNEPDKLKRSLESVFVKRVIRVV